MSSSIGQPDRPTPTAMPERVVTREEFIAAVGVNGNPVQMAQRSALLINHDRALRSALADAERERDEANKELLLLHAQYRQVSNLEALRVREIAALRAERDALRADLLALVPLAKYALPLWEDCGPNERLRAILARVATEGT